MENEKIWRGILLQHGCLCIFPVVIIISGRFVAAPTTLLNQYSGQQAGGTDWDV